MKKTRINLLSTRNDYQKYERYFLWIRTTAVVLSIVFFVILFIYLTFIATQIRTITELNNSKKYYLELIDAKKDEQANILLINQKYNSLQNFLKDDAQSLPYYNLLSDALKTSSEAGTLKSFTIAKNRKTSFSVGFQNFNEMMSFFHFVESPTFLKNFEKVTMKNFSAILNTENQKEKYELAFDAVFIPISNK